MPVHPARLQPVRLGARRRARASSSTSSAAGSPRSRPVPTGSRPPTSRCTSRPARSTGEIEAHGRVLRQGRTTVVLEVDAGRHAPARSLGLATMSFAVLPRRAENLSVDQADRVSRMTMATEDSGFVDRRSTSRCSSPSSTRATGIDRAPAAGLRRATAWARSRAGWWPRRPTPRPSTPCAEACGGPVETVDLQITYLALAKVGARSAHRARVLERARRVRHRARRDRRHRRRRPADDRGTRRRGAAVTAFADRETGRAVNQVTQVSLHEVDDPARPRPTPTSSARSSTLDHLRGPAGNVRAGALLTMADTVGGMCAGLAALPGWVVSTNLMLRTTPGAHVGPLALDATRPAGRPQRGRRRRSRSATPATAARLIADGVLTSAVLEPEGGPPDFPRPMRLVPPDGADPVLPLLEFFGIGAARDAAVALADHRPGEEPVGDPARRRDRGARRRGGHPRGRRASATTADVVLHFLRPGRVGPAVARRDRDRRARRRSRRAGRGGGRGRGRPRDGRRGHHRPRRLSPARRALRRRWRSRRRGAPRRRCPRARGGSRPSRARRRR